LGRMKRRRYWRFHCTSTTSNQWSCNWHWCCCYALVGGNAMMAVQDTNNTVVLGHGLGNEVMQSMLIWMNWIEQVQAQSQQTLLNAMSEMQTQHRWQFQVLNNNIRCTAPHKYRVV
jgi:hypothetical protein